MGSSSEISDSEKSKLAKTLSKEEVLRLIKPNIPIHYDVIGPSPESPGKADEIVFPGHNVIDLTIPWRKYIENKHKESKNPSGPKHSEKKRPNNDNCCVV
ncbi:hypothetical protein ACOME3_009678 [Neoechinorhynchus agilis]